MPPKKARFSLTVRSSYSENFWDMYPIELLIRSRSPLTSKPSTLPSPEDGARMPQSMRIVVLLPAPLGPKKPNISPFPTSKLIESTAVKSPNFLVRFLTHTLCSIIPCPR